MTESPIADAIRALNAAKAIEAEATQARLRAENALLAVAGTLPLEGTTRFHGGGLTAVVQTSIRRSVDADKLREIAGQIPEAIGARLIRWKPELVISELRYIEGNESELYTLVARAIEAKPAKPSIRIEAAKAAEAA